MGVGVGVGETEGINVGVTGGSGWNQLQAASTATKSRTLIVRNVFCMRYSPIAIEPSCAFLSGSEWMFHGMTYIQRSTASSCLSPVLLTGQGFSLVY